jgi:hypothetical protein
MDCNAKHFESEVTLGERTAFTSCCHKGKAILELVPTLMIDDAETKMRTNAAVRVELKTWVLSPQNSGMQNSGCFRLFVLDLGFSMFVFIVLSDLRD